MTECAKFNKAAKNCSRCSRITNCAQRTVRVKPESDLLGQEFGQIKEDENLTPETITTNGHFNMLLTNPQHLTSYACTET